MAKKKVVTNMAMKIGYIQEIDLQLNPQYKERFRFKEASFTRRISSRGDRVYSKMLAYPVDYEEIVDNATIMKKNSKVILVREPFLLDDELRKKVTEWVEWAGECTKCHLGIVRPDDSCEFGERRATTHV